MKSRSRVHTPAATPAGAAAATGAALIVVAAFLGLIALIAGSAPLYADWIVTRQGDRFEIRGTWQLKGKLVVFTLPNGTLSSMRADRVDLDASKQATALAKKQAEAPPAAAVPAEPKRRAVIVLTDKNFKKAAPPESAAGDAAGVKTGGKDSPADSPAARSAPSTVEVVAWERAPTSESKANGAELTGTVRNTSQDILTEVSVVAALFDDNGGLIGRFPAVVDRQQLPPAETSKFHLVANGVFAFAAIRWETTGKGFKSVQPAPTPPPG
jgi:hypothetical protein